MSDFDDETRKELMAALLERDTMKELFDGLREDFVKRNKQLDTLKEIIATNTELQKSGFAIYVNNLYTQSRDSEMLIFMFEASTLNAIEMREQMITLFRSKNKSEHEIDELLNQWQDKLQKYLQAFKEKKKQQE